MNRCMWLIPAMLGVLSCTDKDVSGPDDSTGAESLSSTAAALSFRHIAAGYFHSCGVTTANVAYCWGYNSNGQLGDGTFTARLRPVPVLGGLQFRAVSAGLHHSCGVATDNQAYCW